MKPRLAIIYWRDAWRNGDRDCGKELMIETGREVCIVETVGFILERTKDHIILVGSINYWDDFDSYKTQQHIPMAMVEKVKYLKEK